MRLLHTTEPRFGEFFEENSGFPTYAILSHRWGKDEMTYQEMQFALLSQDDRARVLTPSLLNAEAKLQGPGYRKVLRFRALAAKHGFEWCWIDTVCIDKTSSAELSEAINSMFRWYKHASFCCAHLADVHPVALPAEIRASEYWCRGWTLQELLAPQEVDFFYSNWEFLMSRNKSANFIAEITAIDVNCLKDPELIFKAPIARRMTWASDRVTTRLEDEAYCLLGLCNINMPLLYGEGIRAFRRLCEEIVCTTDDVTVFDHSGVNMLPISPRKFGDPGLNPSQLPTLPQECFRNVLYSLTNRGLRVQNAPCLDIEWTRKIIFFKAKHPGILILRIHCNQWTRVQPSSSYWIAPQQNVSPKDQEISIMEEGFILL